MLFVLLLQLLSLEIAFLAAANLPLQPDVGIPAPPASKLKYLLKGSGTQKYQCVENSGVRSWKRYQVDAELSDSQSNVMGVHFLLYGNTLQPTPVWEIGKERIFGIVTKTLHQDNSDIPWLELSASGDTNVTRVYRTRTSGGVAPAKNPCRHVGLTINVPYSALYSFWVNA